MPKMSTVTIFVILIALGNILNESSKAEIKAQVIEERLAELNEDLEDLHQYKRNMTWLLEQYQRKQLVKKVCNKYGNPNEFKKLATFIVDPKVLNVQ